MDDRETSACFAGGERTEPLRPDQSKPYVSRPDEEAKRKELLRRLDRATQILNRNEETRDSRWELDPPTTNVNAKLRTDDAKLPQHVEENIKGIVRSARDYIDKLEEQLRDLRLANVEIENSTVKTLNEIDEAYQELMDEICREINKRRDLLRLETRVYKSESLVPLKACKEEVTAQIRGTRQLIDSIENMLKFPQTFNRERLGKIINASSNIGRIPAVPCSEELPYVNFSHPLNSFKDELLERISQMGCVLRTGPVQISDIIERPGSLFVKWVVIDPEFAGEEQVFVVQKTAGEIPDADVFQNVYEGSETSCFVRDLPINQPVTLRVGIQGVNGAWSAHRVGQTTIPPYSWELENKNYIITNEGRIAAKITDVPSTLFSEGPQFDNDHVIEFKFLETWQDATDDEGIALVFNPQGKDDTLKRYGSLFVTPTGKIFMDGEEKLMRLPRIRLGTKIVFSAMRKDVDTVRVNIECTDRAVTYDWTVQMPLHFAARFTEYNKWNLMVK